VKTTRRSFFRWTFGWALGIGFWVSGAATSTHRAFAETGKTVVPKGTPWTDLRNRNPKDLDTRNLDITPLKDFGTMGLEEYSPDMDTWRLIVDGEVEKPLSLTYAEVLEVPAVERAVLMICPGFFANHGLWKGASVRELLLKAQAEISATHVTFRGPEGKYEKVMRVPVADVHSDLVFVAYQVNGETLPQKHGFPVRLVAEGYDGSDWVKYVYKITVERISS